MSTRNTAISFKRVIDIYCNDDVEVSKLWSKLKMTKRHAMWHTYTCHELYLYTMRYFCYESLWTYFMEWSQWKLNFQTFFFTPKNIFTFKFGIAWLIYIYFFNIHEINCLLAVMRFKTHVLKVANFLWLGIFSTWWLQKNVLQE